MLLRVYTFGLVVALVKTAEDPTYWRNLAKENLNKYLNNKPNINKARNIVLMIGDGMGLSTTVAARTLKGQLQGRTGEETELNFEKFPYTAFSKVYTTDFQVPDSAATMTAILTGVKTKSRVLGVDSSVIHDTCQDLTNHRLPNILHWMQEAGKSAGFVTTARVTHATPAALYATTTNRDWENDHNVPRDEGGHCSDIASQLVYNNSDIKVVLGGGVRNFIPIQIQDPTTGKIDYRGQRHDGKNLIQEWLDDKETRNVTHRFVYNTGQLDSVDPASTDYLLGLFSKSHMSYEMERDRSEIGEPSLQQMTRKAIEMLNKNRDGYFLLVEGARIDHGHHAVKAKHALTETLAFEEAVQAVIDMTNDTDTLVIVTADHSHTMTIAGYPERGNGILDIVKMEGGEPYLAEDDLPYTTLAYTNGPNSRRFRRNLTSVDTSQTNFKQDAMIDMLWETHSGEDVAVYAKGPMAHLLTGVKEQNVIAYVMAHAACVGDIGVPCTAGREVTSTNIYNCDNLNINAAVVNGISSVTIFVICLYILNFCLFA